MGQCSCFHGNLKYKKNKEGKISIHDDLDMYLIEKEMKKEKILDEEEQIRV